jgi:hypothetical protein
METEAFMRYLASPVPHIKAVLIIALGVSSFAVKGSAQDWQEIKPIGSTCKDVERVLGGEVCGKREVEYKLPTATIYVGFAMSSCEERWLGRYDIPPGTVTNLQVFLAPPYLTLAALNIDESKLTKGDAGDQLDILVYESRELGIKLEASKAKDVITLLKYPATKYDHLRCPSKERPRLTGEGAGGRLVLIPRPAGAGGVGRLARRHLRREPAVGRRLRLPYRRGRPRLLLGLQPQARPVWGRGRNEFFTRVSYGQQQGGA